VSELTSIEAMRVGLYHARRTLLLLGGDQPVPDGLDATFYHTLSAEGDRREIAEVKKQIAAIEAAISQAESA
jgi:hypothetical protein